MFFDIRFKKKCKRKFELSSESGAGFTLIELIVVIAVLLFVVGTALGIFISIVQHQKIILAEQELLNQVSYALEHISKALRMAGKDTDGSCLGPDYLRHNYLLTDPIAGIFYTGIKFINQSDTNEVTGLPVCQKFYLDNGILKEIKDNSQWVALTSDRLFINSIKFGINGKYKFGAGDDIGASGNNFIQPRITIYLDIQTKGDNQSTKKFQTTISQRNLNVQ